MAEIRKIGKLYTDGKNYGKEIKQNPSGGWFVVPLDEAPDVVKRTGKFERKQKIHNELTEEMKYLKHLEGKVSKQNLDNAVKTTLEHYKKRLRGKDTITDIPEAYRHYEKDYENELRAREYGYGSKKLPEEKDYLPGGKKWNKEWESARETKFSRKEKSNKELSDFHSPTKEEQRIKNYIESGASIQRGFHRARVLNNIEAIDSPETALSSNALKINMSETEVENTRKNERKQFYVHYIMKERERQADKGTQTKVKEGTPLQSMADQRVHEIEETLYNDKSMLRYAKSKKLNGIGGMTTQELENQIKQKEKYIRIAKGDKYLKEVDDRINSVETHFAGEELYSDDPNRYEGTLGMSMKEYNEKMQNYRTTKYSSVKEATKDPESAINKYIQKKTGKNPAIQETYTKTGNIRYSAFGIERTPEDDFSDDGTRFTAYRLPNGMGMTVAKDSDDIYLSVNTPNVDKLNLEGKDFDNYYKDITSLPHYKELDKYNGVRKDSIDLNEVIKNANAYKNEYNEYLKSKGIKPEVRTNKQLRLDSIKSKIEQNKSSIEYYTTTSGINRGWRNQQLNKLYKQNEKLRKELEKIS